MGVGYNPKIVTDGLVLCLDAANPKSYNYNIATYSQDFTNAVYSKSTGLISATGLLAPDGTLTATTMTDDDAANWESFVRNFTVPNDSSTYNVSLYIRKTTGGTSPTTGFNISFAGGTQKNYFPRFNTDTGSLGGGDTNVVTSENNNYWRISFTISNNGTGNTTLNISYYPATGPYGGSDASTATGSQTVWGFQVTRGATLLPYRFNVADSNTNWKDLSGNGYDFTLVNGPSYNDGGISLDGTNDYSYLPSHNSNLAFPNGSMTLIVWEKLNTYPSYGGIISTDTNGDMYWKIYRDVGETNYKFRWGASAMSFPSFTIGKWNMYCAVKDASTNVYLYFNGALASTHTVSQTISTQNNPITIGSYRYNDAVNGYYLSNQVIGPMSIYNRALTAAEIQQNFNASRGRFGI